MPLMLPFVPLDLLKACDFLTRSLQEEGQSFCILIFKKESSTMATLQNRFVKVQIVHGLMNKGSFESVIFMTSFCSKQFPFLCLVKFDLFKNLTSQKLHLYSLDSFFHQFLLVFQVSFSIVSPIFSHCSKSLELKKVLN